jgi:hypothetical protein
MESCVAEEKLKLLAELAKLERKALEKNIKNRGNRICSFIKLSDENPFCSSQYVLLISVFRTVLGYGNLIQNRIKESLFCQVCLFGTISSVHCSAFFLFYI